MAAPFASDDTKRISVMSSPSGRRYALVPVDDDGQPRAYYDGMQPINIVSPALANEPRIIFVDNPSRAPQNVIVQAPAPPPAEPVIIKKKEPMHPLLKGLIVLTAGPFVMAGALVVAAGSVVYGAGAVVVGVGDLMTGGPLKKKARRAWRQRNANKNARRAT